MENKWSQKDIEGADSLETLVYATRLLGNEPELVLWGGGNTSLKRREKDFRGREVDVLRVKGTGANMATIDASGFAGVRLDDVLPLREWDEMGDEEMVDYLDHTLMEPKGRRPSVETFLHAFIPHPAVFHTHANAILALADAEDGEEHIKKALGPSVGVVPYFRPGFPLAKAVAEVYDSQPDIIGVVLMNHGLVTWGGDCREAYDRHIELVSRAEAYVEARRKPRPKSSAVPEIEPATRHAVIAKLLPIFRGLVGKDERVVTAYDDSQDVLGFLARPDIAALSQIGPATPDHLLHTKRLPCLVQVVDPSDVEELESALREAVGEYAKAYKEYVDLRNVDKLPESDPFPRVVLIPGIGMVTTGRDNRSARIVRDIYRQTIQVIEGAEAVSGYRSLTVDQAFAAEYWPLERYKLTLRKPTGELEGKVALVTGGAKGIGKAVAERLLEDGAQVILADLDGELAQEAASSLDRGMGDCIGVTMDVTDPAAVERGFQEAVLAFGGLDILVSNAGIAPTGAVIDLPLETWELSFAVNSTGHFLASREAVRIMTAQGTGGAIVFNCTKNITAPGPKIAAYSAAKAAAAQLARVLAMEHGADKIRVNIVNPDSVFTDLWSPQVREDRAAAYGISVDQLEEHYRNRTLLKESVTPRDVAEAVYFLVSERSAKTTGCMIPVDAGISTAFPR